MEYISKIFCKHNIFRKIHDTDNLVIRLQLENFLIFRGFIFCRIRNSNHLGFVCEKMVVHNKDITNAVCFGKKKRALIYKMIHAYNCSIHKFIALGYVLCVHQNGSNRKKKEPTQIKKTATSDISRIEYHICAVNNKRRRQHDDDNSIKSIYIYAISYYGFINSVVGENILHAQKRLHFKCFSFSILFVVLLVR